MRLIRVLLVMFCFGTAYGFLPPVDTAGPVTISIGDPGKVTVLGERLRVDVTVKNSGATSVAGAVRLEVIDDWQVEDGAPKAFSVKASGTQSVSFNVIPGKGSYAALYPIHAYATFRVGAADLTAHAILIASVSPEAVAHSAAGPAPLLKVPRNGEVRLDVAQVFQPSIALQGANAVAKGAGWQGTDEATGATVSLLEVDRGGIRHALAVHPAWRTGWGDVFVDYHVALPDQKPVGLDFATAIRDNTAKEPPSDGVEYRVLVRDGGEFKTLFTRFSAAKGWEAAHVDLSAYAGREVTLRLVTDPGPAHNTVCDQCYWAEPTLSGGAPEAAEPEGERAARRAKAMVMATGAEANSGPWSWKLAPGVAAAAVPGPNGIADASIVFAAGGKAVAFDGFNLQIDGKAERGSGVKSHFAAGRGTISYPDGAVATIWAEHGALRIGFAMPGVRRDSRGEPRFTELGIGAGSEKAHRVYAGFGNVLQEPGRFDLNGGGFTLSTRHVGIDFANGLSLVEACDVFPDRFHVDPERRSYSLITHHDATFSFVPSEHGAFAAARIYHDLVQFKPAGGVAKLLGRICLDQWDGDYGRAAQGIEMAARYGLTDAVFVKHVWQRWGYDYRLPDIYPPAGNFDDFHAMVDACKRYGILFCPHDNYIDFYPDADGYSYDDILFNADGTPQKAWFNTGRGAQAYRWSPNAFGPWLEANLKRVKEGFGPTAYFVDVFSAIPPIDFYDRQGRFFAKTVAAERWGAAFDRIREILGDHAPTISEAGQDGLIGHLDAGEADHGGWLPDIKDTKVAPFHWNMKAEDGERIPWHDMASHGSFVLLGGGLGPRYAAGQDATLHGYASDDYLSITVLGGRNPMCEGPFSRQAVMTYWLLHDVCRGLAHGEMLSDEFAGNDIHRQISRFSDGGVAQVNRGKSDWTTDGQVLPEYGFVAKAGDYEADITRRKGVITACAKSPGSLFVDARPANVAEGDGEVLAKVTGVEDLGNRRLRLRIDWQVSQPVKAGYGTYVHFVGDDGGKNEGILFQGILDLNAARLTKVGTYSSKADVTVPESVGSAGEVGIRFGLYSSGPGGRRLPMLVPLDADERARGGTIRMDGDAIHWQPEPADPTVAERAARLNMAGKVVNFGAAATNGAFRLLTSGGNWELIPLPGSEAFTVKLRLDRLNAAGRKVRAITQEGVGGAEVKFEQNGESVDFEAAGGVFGYRILLGS